MDGISKVSFNFLYTLWVYRTCIYLLIYILKNCHQHSYGFENLFRSWRPYPQFSKLPYVRVFWKNHFKSKVFQKHERQQAFFELFPKNWRFTYFLFSLIFKRISFSNLTRTVTSPARTVPKPFPTKSVHSPSGVQRRFTQRGAQRRV